MTDEQPTDTPDVSAEGPPIESGAQLQMIAPQMLPEVVHCMNWADPEGNAGVLVLISTPLGQEYHYWPHDMAIGIASNIKKTAQTGPGIIPVTSKLLLPAGAR